MNIKKLLYASLVFAFFQSNVQAAQHATTEGSDTRVQIFKYDKSDVYIINAQVGYSTLIQLADDEVIPDNGGLGMGDSQAWSLEVRSNNIFFKPVQELPDTNMLLVTNKRTYAFQLTTNIADVPTYIASFEYPSEPVAKTATDFPELKNVGVNQDGLKIFINSNINTDYYYKGDQTLEPTNAWDDSRFTYLKFNHAGDLPVVYRVYRDGTETLVNTHIENDIMIVQEKGGIYRLRHGQLVGDVSQAAQKDKKPAAFNKTGTSNDLIRINK